MAFFFVATHVGEVGRPGELVADKRQGNVAFQACQYRAAAVAPAVNGGGGVVAVNGGAAWGVVGADFAIVPACGAVYGADVVAFVNNAVFVVVVEEGQRGEVAVFFELDADFFVQAGFGFDVAVAQEVAGAPPVVAAGISVFVGVGGCAAAACIGLGVGVVPVVVAVDGAAVAGVDQEVVFLGLVQVGSFKGTGDAAFDFPVAVYRVREVERGGEHRSEGGVVVPAQAGDEVGSAFVERDVVFGIKGVVVLRGFAAAAFGGQPRDLTVGFGGGGHGEGVVEHRAVGFRADGYGVAAERQVGFGAEAVVFQNAVGKTSGAVVRAFGAAEQAFGQVAVDGFVEADIAFGFTPVPDAVMGEGVALAVDFGGFAAQKLGGDALDGGNEYVAVLGVAVVDVALTAVCSVEGQTLFGGDVPGEAAGDVAVAQTFAAGGEGGARRFDAVVDVERIGVGFVQAAVDAEAQFVLHDGAAQQEVGAAGVALLCAACGLVVKQADAAAKLVADAFGADVDHAAHRAGAVAGGSRAAQHFDFFNHFRRHPVGVAARVAHAAAAVAFGVAGVDGFAVDEDQCVVGPHRTDVDLAFVAALAARGVGAEVDARHFADDFGDVVGNGHLLQVLRGNHRHAELLFGLAFGGNVDGLQLATVFGGVGFGVGKGRAAERECGEDVELDQTGFHGVFRFEVGWFMGGFVKAFFYFLLTVRPACHPPVYKSGGIVKLRQRKNTAPTD